MAGLNPHAGENGALGVKDRTIVAPAIEKLRAEGIDARGPLPADTMFHAAARTRYDAALCMYHDQALIPIKTLAFDHAVNVTLGFAVRAHLAGSRHRIRYRRDRSRRSGEPDRRHQAGRPAGARTTGAGGRAAMTVIDDLPPLREVIRRHGLSARRSLGQNFLLDLNLTARIARAAGPLEGVSVLEIGPGPGGLTRALLAAGARRVIGVERDPRAVAALADIGTYYPGRLEIVEADASDFDPRLSRCRPNPRRGQPSIQHRDPAAGCVVER